MNKQFTTGSGSGRGRGRGRGNHRGRGNPRGGGRGGGNRYNNNNNYRGGGRGGGTQNRNSFPGAPSTNIQNDQQQNKRKFSKRGSDSDDEVAKVKPKTETEEAAIKIERLFKKNGDRLIRLPERPKKREVSPPPDFMRSLHGISHFLCCWIGRVT
jgi:hypothetical protein